VLQRRKVKSRFSYNPFAFSMLCRQFLESLASGGCYHSNTKTLTAFFACVGAGGRRHPSLARSVCT